MKTVPLEDLFRIETGLASSFFKEGEIIDSPMLGFIPYIRPSYLQSSSIAGYVDETTISETFIYPPETLYVSTDGEGSHTFSYVSPFYFVPNSNVSCLMPKTELTLNQKLFYAQAITCNRKLFSYGRKPKGKRLAHIHIPSLDSISVWVNEIQLPEVSHQALVDTPLAFINPSQWQSFKIAVLFDTLQKGRCGSAEQMLSDGNDLAYIGAKKENNGVQRFVERDDALVSAGNALVFVCTGAGAVGYTTYQPYDFIGHTNIVVGYASWLTPAIGLFLVTILDLERPKYSYGRSYTMNAIKNTIIKLPSTSAGQPDWQWMEHYIKSLPYSTHL